VRFDTLICETRRLLLFNQLDLSLIQVYTKTQVLIDSKQQTRICFLNHISDTDCVSISPNDFNSVTIMLKAHFRMNDTKHSLDDYD